MSHDGQPTNLGRRTMQTMRGQNVQDREVKGQNAKEEYKVIEEIEH